MNRRRYQVGSWGAGGEWHPATEYTETYATRAEADWALAQIESDNPAPDDVRSPSLVVREISSPA